MPTPVARKYVYICRECGFEWYELVDGPGPDRDCLKCTAIDITPKSIPLYAEHPPAVAALRKCLDLISPPDVATELAQAWAAGGPDEVNGIIDAGRSALAAYAAQQTDPNPTGQHVGDFHKSLGAAIAGDDEGGGR